MAKITDNENFFVEGAGRAVVHGDNGQVGFIHLQNANFEISSKMEDIFGGEGNFSLYSFQTEKGCKASFTNASMSLDTVKLTQGVGADTAPVLFNSETVTVGVDGTLTFTKTGIEDNSVVISQNGTVVPVTFEAGKYKVAVSLASQKVDAFYRYTASADAVGASVLTTSVPGYVEIYHESKPLKQKNGRIVKIYTIIYKARCDGSLKMDYKNKNAFAPELTFNAVDPERADGKFISFTVKDVTDQQ